MRCKQWEVWWATVSLNNQPKPKSVPVVIAQITPQSIIVFPAAKSIPTGCKGHELEYWHFAKLPLNSCILMTPYKLSENELTHKKGDLHILDVNSIEAVLGWRPTTIKTQMK